jgi:hypothetical protein
MKFSAVIVVAVIAVVASVATVDAVPVSNCRASQGDLGNP